MQAEVKELGLIAGRGSYPLLFAESARAGGVQRIAVVAFKGETDQAIEKLVDSVTWIHVGQLSALLLALEQSGVRHVVMAGQLTPTALFKVRMDGAMLALLKTLPTRNAETIFGAVGAQLARIGVELLPAHLFMESCMPQRGVLTERAPTTEEWLDIELGVAVAKATSGLDIGQTVVVKEGTILAVEAFEGTDAAIRRAGELGGRGSVIVKMSKQGHDMRFDIPVAGLRTVQSMRKSRSHVLAVEAGRSMILDREEFLVRANRLGVAVVAVDAAGPFGSGETS